jgi:hypothetical protein
MFESKSKKSFDDFFLFGSAVGKLTLNVRACIYILWRLDNSG